MQVFEFDDYKPYLRAGSARGRRAEMARQLRCHPAFISRVLNADAHLSLEQAERLNTFLGHDDLASRYFMLLVSHAKAGTVSLKNFYRRELRLLSEQQRNLKHRYEESQWMLPDAVAERYYSHWSFAAIDVMIASGITTDEADIARRLSLPLERVERGIAQLLEWRLLERNAQGKLVGAEHLHLPKDSPHIVRHHINWRTKALAQLADKPESGVHYSSVMVISREEALRFESEILGFIEKLVARGNASPSEELYSFCLDFFVP